MTAAIPNTRNKGFEIEKLAADYLKSQNLEILVQNFNCKMGEIDLICLEKDTVVFAEVRFRNTLLYGGPKGSITYLKQRKIIKTAQYFLKTKPKMADLPCRFDVLAVTLNANEPNIEWIQNAFQATPWR